MEATTRELFQAIGTKQIASLKELLDAGIPVNEPEGDNTPLTWAAKKGEPECVKVLFAAGAALESVDRFNDTALLSAASLGHVEAVRILLAAGAKVNHRGKTFTPLAAAVRDRTEDRLEIVRPW